MIVYANVFEVKSRTSMADYTLPYQLNDKLDYDFIAQKCEKVIRNLEDFDDEVHQMDSRETKGLFYFFRYVKKNLWLISAIDMIPGLYEDQLKDMFVKFH